MGTMKGAGATLTLAWGCVTLGACQLVGGITDRTLAMTGAAVECDESTVLFVAGLYSRQRILGPRNPRRRSSWRLRLPCRPAVGTQSNRAAKRGPTPERWTILLETTQHEEPDEKGSNEDHCH